MVKARVIARHRAQNRPKAIGVFPVKICTGRQAVHRIHKVGGRGVDDLDAEPLVHDQTIARPALFKAGQCLCPLPHRQQRCQRPKTIGHVIGGSKYGAGGLPLIEFGQIGQSGTAQGAAARLGGIGGEGAATVKIADHGRQSPLAQGAGHRKSQILAGGMQTVRVWHMARREKRCRHVVFARKSQG